MVIKTSRNEVVNNILEYQTQKYFDNICEDLSYGDRRIRKDDLFLVRSTLGPITYNNFVAYVESMGIYTLDET